MKQYHVMILTKMLMCMSSVLCHLNSQTKQGKKVIMNNIHNFDMCISENINKWLYAMKFTECYFSTLLTQVFCAFGMNTMIL